MDDSPASNLPVEIWIKIALTLRDEGLSWPGSYCVKNDIDAVRPLSESCRWLLAVIQPIIYEDIAVYAGNKNIDRVAGLASTFSTRPDLRSAVRSLRLTNVQLGGHCDALLDVLPLLVEVRFLSLRLGVIEEPIVQLFRNAPHLHTLRIHNVRWGVDVSEKWSEDGSFGRNLTELQVQDMDADLPHRIPRIMQLFVPAITKLKIDPRLATELMKSPAHLSFGPSLRQLIATAPIYDVPLHQFLSRCSNLEELDAEGLRLVSPINEEYLPKLRSIKADIAVVTALLPGRPIRSITTMADPKIFANPLPCLEVLYLDGLSEQGGGLVIDALWIACPRLIRLELQPTNTRAFELLAKRIETRLALDAAVLPRLQILNLMYHSYWATPMAHPPSEEIKSERERIVQVKRQYCPDLCDVRLSPNYAWVYIRDDDAWTQQDLSFI